ncbi:hypothetical protein [Devosia sp. RR2S18]|uniref:hypothetical protein n=1 Tax=Devosia rhizosphaerae TaxID=3049774 RepID=UPI0025407A94|nr:hypothetical protein [Devosia sp. RR2S18]WIJ26948.1 hypothetical protein QOV41_09460 [Devosia sp. RR2S18]
MLKLNSIVVAKLFFGVPAPAGTYPVELDEIFTWEEPTTLRRSTSMSAINPNDPEHGGSMMMPAADRARRTPCQRL